MATAAHSLAEQLSKANSLRLILPFLRPIAGLIEDESISEIMINGNGTLFIERGGRLEELENPLAPEKILVGVKNIARQLGKDFGEAAPLLDARLPNGSRICAAWPSVSLGGMVTLNIRKFQGFKSIPELVALGSLPNEVLRHLQQALSRRANILISGGVGVGKTVLLRALVTLIDPSERIITIEDTAELAINSHRCCNALEGKIEQRDASGCLINPAVTARDLVKLAMRQRPDRLIIGEVRGAEAFDLLKALNSGSSGSLSSIHADSAKLALEKLALYVLEANSGLPMEAVYRSIGSAVQYVVHQERRIDGSRGVAQLIQIDGFDRIFKVRALYGRTDPTI
jgi:pilus assembly protein CpaF